MKITICLITAMPSGSVAYEIDGEVKLTTGIGLNDHDLAGMLFAVEFAVNHHASEIFGKPVRMHILTK